MKIDTGKLLELLEKKNEELAMAYQQLYHQIAKSQRIEKELVAYRKRLEDMVVERTAQLEEQLAGARRLSGFIDICASCKKIRDKRGFWNKIETYIQKNSEAVFSHSICPQCAKRLYPDIYFEPVDKKKTRQEKRVGQSKKKQERRKSKRIKLKDCKFETGARVGEIIDISIDGLAFCYIDTGTLPTDCEEGIGRLFGEHDDICLENLPYKVISDHALGSGVNVARRCGIKFGKLTARELAQLEYFISLNSGNNPGGEHSA